MRILQSIDTLLNGLRQTRSGSISLISHALRTCFYPLSFIFATCLLTACATTPGDSKNEEAIFYPPLPNSPRVQYLATFSSETDASGDSSGFKEFLLGSRENEAPLVQKPYGVNMYDGAIYVTDTRGHGYGVFDLRNKRAFTVTGSGAGRMSFPVNITIDQNGQKYITDTIKNQIFVFDKDNRFVRAYGQKDWFKPGDVALSADKLFVTDLKNHQIQVLSKETGEQLYNISRPGQQEGELFYPTNLEIGVDGYLYVSDTGNFRVQKFSLEGEFKGSFGSVGVNPGQFARPKGIALDREGRRYVIDAAFENVQIFSAEDELLLFFGAAGVDRDSINLPTDIEIIYDDVDLFQQYADPRFKLEYIILVASQFGLNKVNAYGFGKMEGMQY